MAVYDFFRENNTAYMTLEYLTGMTLKDYVKSRVGRLSFDEVAEKMMPAMRSLQKLHEMGILHRDISPNNIMIQNDGTMTLFDFGGAKTYDEDSEKSVVVCRRRATSRRSRSLMMSRGRGRMFMPWRPPCISAFAGSRRWMPACA